MIANKDYALIKAIKNRCKCNGDSSSEGGGSIDLDSMSLEELSNLVYQASIKSNIEGIETVLEHGASSEAITERLRQLKNAPKNISEVTTSGDIIIKNYENMTPTDFMNMICVNFANLNDIEYVVPYIEE